MLGTILCFIVSIIAFKIYQKMTLKTFISEARIPDKVVIVTGSNTGIGYATAKELARRGARVYLACRDLAKAKTAVDKIKLATGREVVAKPLDLSSFQSVHAFVKDFMETERNLDILINNAGTGVLDNSLTKDNLPIEAQVNYFSPYLLTMLLLPIMKKSSRIINVSSLMHKIGTVENLDKQGKNFLQRRRVYSNTKLANIMFTRKLAEELKDKGITVNCLHPGAVNTEIFRNQPRIIRFLLKLLFLTPEEGAQTIIFLSVLKSLDGVTGKYFSNCTEETPAKRALDDEATEKLWTLSQKICFSQIVKL